MDNDNRSPKKMSKIINSELLVIERSVLAHIWHNATKKPLGINIPRGNETSQEGFEPPTVRLEGGCSIQLSYCDSSFATIAIIEKLPLLVNANSLFY